MEIVSSRFLKSLAESGLMNEAEIEAFLCDLPPEQNRDDGAALAQELVRQKKLTKFQAQAVYQGKVKALVLGDYVVLDRIGQGGMGQVFKAQHTVMKRVVALKTLPLAATKTENAVRRFHREVEVAARLSHPNIVTAHDAGEAHGLHYLVMECVDGSDLSSFIKERGRLPVDTAVDYIIQTAKALEYAHTEGVIHRDIKPSNLLLGNEGTVKVLDMGLARLNRRLGADGEADEDALTGTGDMMGTVDFMPPEQAVDTKTADERSDIYSLGCTLYYLLTGHSPYSGNAAMMKLLAHRENAIPSLRDEIPEIPQQVDDVYQKMVQKKPDDRYASMAQVITELERFVAPPKEHSAETAFDGIKEDTTIDFNVPVVSPLDESRNARSQTAKRAKTGQRQIVAGAIALGLVFVFLLLGVVFMLRTPDGMLVVEINEDDVVVQVLDEQGKVEITREGDKGKLSISVDPGKHRLEVEKDGFSLYVENFEMEEGGKKVITARLEPLVVAKKAPKTAAASSGANFALEFDGKTSGVHIPTLDYDGSYPITIEACVTPLSLPVEGGLIVRGGVGLATSRPGGYWEMEVRVQSPKGGYMVGSDHEPAKGVPLHLAGVFDGRTIRLYDNGVRSHRQMFFSLASEQMAQRLERDATVQGKIVHLKTGFLIGRGGNAKTESFHFHGIIDEVRISKIARYTKDFTPEKRFEPDEHTMALYHFDEGSGDVLKDSSGNDHHGKIVGAKWVKVDDQLRVAKEATAMSPDRQAAEWALGLGGKIDIIVDGQMRRRQSSMPEENFRLGGIHLADCEGVDEASLAKLRGLSELQSLSLVNTGVTDSLLKLISELNKLTVLALGGNELTEAGLKTIGEMRKLRALCLNGTGVTDAGLEHLSSLSELSILTIGVNVTDVGLSKLIGLPNLVALGLSERHVTETGVEILKKMPKLQWLYVRNDSLGDEGIECLKGLRNLKGLYFCNGPNTPKSGHVTDSGVAALRAELPNCKIEITDGSPDIAFRKVDELQKLSDYSAPDDTPTDQPPLAVAPFKPEEAKQHQQAWAKHLSVPVETTNSIGMKMMLIPPGEFMMGSPEDEPHRRDDEHQHQVRISKPFCLQTTEVTQGQWESLMGTKPWNGEPDVRDGSDYPATTVSWEDASAWPK